MTFQIVDYDAVQQGHVKSGISSLYPLIDYINGEPVFCPHGICGFPSGKASFKCHASFPEAICHCV